MNILGFNFDHDASVAVIKNGKIISAISNERISRIKKSTGITSTMVNYVLKESNLKITDIDAIALADYHLDVSNGVLQVYDGDIQIHSTRHVFFGNDYAKAVGHIMGEVMPVYIIPHHTAHAASAYYTSNFDKAWCFTMDSSNGVSQANSLIAKGIGNKLTAVSIPGQMVGVGYQLFTEKIGLGRALFKAGSTMGLASYGKPLTKVVENINKYITESYFAYDAKEEVFFEYYNKLWKDLTGSDTVMSKRETSSKKAMDLAATIQYLFEECILDVVNNKIEIDDIDNLCLAGGSFLNCNANSKVKKYGRFKNLHHFPACGDDGNAIGAALFVAHHVFDEPRHNYETKEICYLGKKYEHVEPEYKKIAELIADGKIIAWFMGSSEYGPRALGARSILADPRNFNNKEIINFAVKKREWFRPVAPVVLEEESHKWFDFDCPSPYMLYIAKVLQPEKIPGVTHVDGTARIQTINKKTNEPYYKLVKEFSNITGVPILINTSLNTDGEPILETEEEALIFFETNKHIDALILNGKLIVR
jgi:carbamoyltransferase